MAKLGLLCRFQANHHRRMRKYLSLSLLFFNLQAFAQTVESDWDAYVVDVKGKPVSIMVDLTLKSQAPMKDRPMALVVRTKLQAPRPDGQPNRTEIARLDSLEDEMVSHLAKATGAVYAGRFTQRGIREFCFYALDSVGYSKALFAAFSGYPGYEWLGKAVEDKAWSNYFDMLYPAPDQFDRMRFRRQSDALRMEGDPLEKPRLVEHRFQFKTRVARDQFLRLPGMGGFSILELPDLPQDGKDFPFSLSIQQAGIPDYRFIEDVVMPLRTKALELKGKYEGWFSEKLP
jgi:Family of unknown function (DUF695)/Regulator of ribonuclease activity B